MVGEDANKAWLKMPGIYKERFPFLEMAKKDYVATLYEVIEKSDILLEVLDARFFEETRNTLAEKKIAEEGKKLIYVLNKIDLVGLKELKKKVHHLYPRVFFSCSQRKGGQKLRERILMVAKELPYDKAFVGIIGYPNTGKSSLINVLKGKAVARTSSESGFTKGMQKVKLSGKITLIDTPGVIPEDKYSSSPGGKELTELSKIGVKMHDKVKNPEIIVEDLLKSHPGILEKHYNLAEEPPLTFLERVAKKRNYLLKGGRWDLDRAAREVLRDWQRGKILLKEI